MKTVIALVLIIIAIIAVTMNQAIAQSNQVFHMRDLAKTKGATFPSFMEQTVNDTTIALTFQLIVSDSAGQISPVASTTITVQ